MQTTPAPLAGVNPGASRSRRPRCRRRRSLRERIIGIDEVVIKPVIHALPVIAVDRGRPPHAVSPTMRPWNCDPMIDEWAKPPPTPSSPRACSTAMRAVVPVPVGQRSERPGETMQVLRATVPGPRTAAANCTIDTPAMSGISGWATGAARGRRGGSAHPARPARGLRRAMSKPRRRHRRWRRSCRRRRCRW